MYRQPSVASSTSFSSGHVQPLHPLSILESPNSVSLANGQPRLQLPRTISLLTPADSFSQEANEIDREADDLFTKNSISEVKNIQRRLRADADAKQEELRVMVGERYRDLLQASSSIISIAHSSEHILDALDEMKHIISAQEIPRTPKGSSPINKNDSNLQTFQSLGAHMKLLLDSPEHLWRLIERKEYFRAAWLFLLARVVHRALMHDDAEDDGNWQLQGISVPDQFPLVQRQWETVAQFRPQISHKATLSLREPAPSVESVCATLLTLYLLDSRPLIETLSIFLVQRSRALSVILSKTSEQAALTHFTKAIKPNGKSASRNSIKPAQLTLKTAQQFVEASLNVISRTVGISRSIFQPLPGTEQSLMTRVLTQIQPDADVSAMKALPPELQLTTQLLLSSLPSSTHFLLLPTNIRSHIPYVDLMSPSSALPQPILTKRLKEWFQKALQDLSQALDIWFSNLQSIREAWGLRSWARKWITSISDLQDLERGDIASVIDDVCGRQLNAIWKASFMMAKEAFRKELDLAVQVSGKLAEAPLSGSSSLPFLLQAPTPPLQSSVNLGSSQANISLRKYKSALQRQVTGRTPLLEQVVNAVATCAETLQKDLKSLKAYDDDTRALIIRLLSEYRPEAEAFCSDLIDALDTMVENIINKRECAVTTFIFISSLTEDLSSSGFVMYLGCEKHIIQTFRDRARALHDHVINRWRALTVSRISQEYWRLCPPGHGDPIDRLLDRRELSTNYVSAITKSLLALSTALQELGILDPSRRDAIAEETLYRFFETLIQGDDDRITHAGHRWNLLLAQKLLIFWDPRLLEAAGSLRARFQELVGIGNTEDEERQLSGYLAGTQTLLAALFPTVKAEATKVDKTVALLRHGIPLTGQELQPPIDVVKPSPRFGLLLVGGAPV